MPPDLQPPPDPMWRGFMKGHDDQFVESLVRSLDAARNRRLDEVKVGVQQQTTHIQEYGQLVRSTREAKTRLEAERQQLQERLDAELSAKAVDTTPILEDLELLKALPGVLGMRVEDGKVLVHVRVVMVSDGRRYDGGDFEVILGMPAPHRYYQRTDCLDMVCTRSGLGRDAHDYLYQHPTFYVTNTLEGGRQQGYFSFPPATAERIIPLRDGGKYGEMMQVVIEAMNGLPHHYLQYFKPLPESEDRLRKLKAQAARKALSNIGIEISHTKILKPNFNKKDF